jgi:hypothetical protein
MTFTISILNKIITVQAATVHGAKYKATRKLDAIMGLKHLSNKPIRHIPQCNILAINT